MTYNFENKIKLYIIYRSVYLNNITVWSGYIYNMLCYNLFWFIL